MQVQDIMTRIVKTARPDSNLAEVVEVMWTQNCGFVPLVDAEGKVTGVVTDRDIAIALGTRGVRAPELTSAEVASAPVVSCTSDENLYTALKTMGERKVRRLVVLDGNSELAGVLSMDDVVLYVEKSGYYEVLKAMRALTDRNIPALVASAGASG